MFGIASILLDASTPSPTAACGVQAASGWLGIDGLVVLAIVTVAAFIYVLANFLPAARREKLRGAANYEILEALFSLALVVVLFVAWSAACNIGPLLTQSTTSTSTYQGLFGADTTYLGNLLYLNGVNLVSNLYSTSIGYMIVANIWYLGATETANFFGSNPVSVLGKTIPGATSSLNPQVDVLFTEFSELFTAIYGALLVGAFSTLFVLSFILPIIEAGAFAVVIPVAIIMRSIPFAGPALRRTSNAFIALAIGFYLVLPLMIAFNSYVATCLNIPYGGGTASCNYLNSFPQIKQYLSGYASVGSLTSATASIFTSTATSGYVSSSGLSGVSCASPDDYVYESTCGDSSTIKPGSCQPFSSIESQVCGTYAISGTSSSYLPTGAATPLTFYSTAFTGLNQFITEMFNSPQEAEYYGSAVASYLFLSVVMLAIDLAITVGFVYGLSKALDSFGQLFGSGPVLGE